jgi:4-amino-4-deoxy-L-arabinose transferase-like glycosyltransferase
VRPVSSRARSAARPAGKKRPSSGILAHATCLTIFVVGTGLRVWHFPVAVHTPDEDAYVTFYAAPLASGVESLPSLVEGYNRRPELHQFPSPTRVGHLWLIVGAMLLSSDHSVTAAASVSAVASVLILALVWLIGAAFLLPWVAAVALLFTATSPMDLAMARRAWGDEPFACVALAMTWACLHYDRSGGKPRWGIICFALAGFAILLKETGILLLGLVTLTLAWLSWRRGDRRRAALMVGCGALTLALTGVVLATTLGGWEPLRATAARFGEASIVNDYMRRYQTGGPDYYVRGLGLLQPVAMALGLAAAVLVPARSRLLRGIGAIDSALPILAGLVLVFIAAAFGYSQKNLRFLSPIYAPLCLLAAGLVVAGAMWIQSRVRAVIFRRWVVALVLGLVTIAVTDHRRFQKHFVERGVPDLATPWFTE